MFITIFLISTDMYLRTNVPFQYTISGNREQVFLLYYKDFFEQICSDVQFISHLNENLNSGFGPNVKVNSI